MQSPDSDVDEDDDEGEEDLQQSDLSPVLGRRPPRDQLEPNMQISPFDVRFSQGRASPEFRDGRLIEETVQLIQAVRCEDGTQEPATWRLEAPFPAIEILQWRCKLRDDQTGRPRLDPKTGGELYDRETKWFTLDNRRLYCLQRVAAKLWPDKAVVDVVELPSGPLTRARQLKNFARSIGAAASWSELAMLEMRHRCTGAGGELLVPKPRKVNQMWTNALCINVAVHVGTAANDEVQMLRWWPETLAAKALRIWPMHTNHQHQILGGCQLLDSWASTCYSGS